MCNDKKEISVEDFILWCENYYNIELCEFQKKIIEITWKNPNKDFYYLIPRRYNDYRFKSNIIYVE